MINKKLLGTMILFGTIMLGIVFAESQIVIDPVTKTITIVTSGSTDTGSTENPTVCTMEYAPVCASIFSGDTAINQTFENRCMMDANSGANYLYDGECEGDTTEVAPPLTEGTEFQKAHAWMYANGLTSYETEEGYRPDDYLTRQEAAKIIGQAYNVLGYSQTIKNSSCSFSDANIMDATLVDHVRNACSRGLFKGYQGEFMPFKALTRPEAMAVLVRMFEGKTSFEAATPRWSDYYIKGRALGLTNLSDQNAFETQITRYEIALYIFRLRNIIKDPNLNTNALNALSNLEDGEPESTVAADFSAIAGSISVDGDPELQEAIRWMNDNGLTAYKTIQNYMPFEVLSREQAAKILVVFAEIFNYDQNTDLPLPAACQFSDATSIDDTLKIYVETACKSEILKGGAGKFMPQGTISKSQFVAALIRMFEGGKLDESPNPRWKNYFEEAQEMGIVSPADAITFDNPITRYEVALFLYRFKVKFQMINSLNTNKLENEIINTVPGSIATGEDGILQSNIYADMNLLQNGNFEIGYIEIFGSRYKVVKSSTEKYFSNNFVRYGDVFDLASDKKIGTTSFIISNGYIIDGTVRLTDNDYFITQLAETNAYYKIRQVR